MDKKELELANLLLKRIKEKDPGLREYLTVSEDGVNLEEIPLANLLYHLEAYYNQATTLQTGVNFLLEEIGINKNHCILVIAVDSLDLYQIVASVVSEITEGYLVARAHTYDEAYRLVSIFTTRALSCGLITVDELDGKSCLPMINRCKALPVCVLTTNRDTRHYVQLIGSGAKAVVDTSATEPILRTRLENAIQDMFMEII